MKTAIPLQEFKKCIILFMVGILCSALTYAIYVLNPLKMMIEYKLQMTPDSMIFSLWKKPPIPVYVKVYIFNITNPIEFLKGGEKLKLEEIGPYVYQEILENHNVTWNKNGTVTYTPIRTVQFVPEMSVRNPADDIVWVPNVPMLGISSALHDSGFFINYPWTSLVNMMGSKPILNITVFDYLWGYEDSLVKFAGNVVPNFINFQKFGLLDRVYDDGHNVITMNVEGNNNMTEEIGRYLSIETFNGNRGMPEWGYQEEAGNETYPENSICNRVYGATEGVLLPTYLDKTAVFRVYRKSFCRPIPIVFKKEVTAENGLQGYLYSTADDFLSPPDENPDNTCYCQKMKTCLRKGLSDMTTCYYNIPSAMSLPHFLDADPSLLKEVEGLQPDEEKHRAKIIFQPVVGVPIKVNSRIQINLIMHNTKYNSKIVAFNNLTVPLFWTDLYIPGLPSNLELLLKLVLHILPVVQIILACLLGITGATMLVLSLSSTIWVLNQQQEDLGLERRDSTDLIIPLSYGQYTTIRILPVIKKITSKTELFS